VIAKVEWHPDELYRRIGFIATNLPRPAERVVAFYNKRMRTMDQGRQRRDQVDMAVVQTPCGSSFMRSPTFSAIFLRKSKRREECVQCLGNGQIDLDHHSSCPRGWQPSTPHVSLAGRPENREYSRQFGSHPGNPGEQLGMDQRARRPDSSAQPREL
jgi:hypothetical protein